MPCIYLIRLGDEKVYVGSTIRFYLRGRHHLKRLLAGRHVNKRLQAGFDATDTFDISAFVGTCEDALIFDEQIWVNHFDAANPAHGYNIVRHVRNSRLGVPHTAATKKRLSEASTRTARRGKDHHNFGKPVSPEHRARMSAGMKRVVTGTVHTPEQKAEASRIRKGKVYVGKRLPDAAYAATREYKRNPVPYRFIDANGALVIVPPFGLKKWCRENNLCYSTMGRIWRKRYQTYRGWTRAIDVVDMESAA